MLKLGYSPVKEQSFLKVTKLCYNTNSKPAAQCVINRAQNGIAAVAGSINLESGGTRHQSIRHIIHPQFDSATMGFR